MKTEDVQRYITAAKLAVIVGDRVMFSLGDRVRSGTVISEFDECTLVVRASDGTDYLVPRLSALRLPSTE